MESGQHGGSKPSTTDNNNNTSDSTNPITFANEDEDEAFAKRLQEEAYRANDNTDDMSVKPMQMSIDTKLWWRTLDSQGL